MEQGLVPENVFPFVVPSNKELTAYEGPIQITGRAGQLTTAYLTLHSIPRSESTLRGAVLECSWSLRKLLAGQEITIQKRLSESHSVAAFFNELKALIERQVFFSDEEHLPSVSLCRRVLEDCAALGWQSIKGLSRDLKTLVFVIHDPNGRAHDILCSLADGYPQAAPLTEADLPQQLELSWRPGEDSLTVVREQYEAAIARWQELWRHLEDIDEHCCVLEPSRPSRADVHRRVSLGGFCSLHLTVDAGRPAAPPEARFLGAEASVAELRRLWAERAAREWDPTRLARLNLQQILGIALLSRDAAAADEGAANACGICYAYRSPEDGAAPDANCDNPRCGRPFHRRCLAEWLRSLPDTRQSFGILFGQCVYCSSPLSVKTADAD